MGYFAGVWGKVPRAAFERRALRNPKGKRIGSGGASPSRGKGKRAAWRASLRRAVWLEPSRVLESEIAEGIRLGLQPEKIRLGRSLALQSEREMRSVEGEPPGEPLARASFAPKTGLGTGGIRDRSIMVLGKGNAQGGGRASGEPFGSSRAVYWNPPSPKEYGSRGASPSSGDRLWLGRVSSRIRSKELEKKGMRRDHRH